MYASILRVAHMACPWWWRLTWRYIRSFLTRTKIKHTFFGRYVLEGARTRPVSNESLKERSNKKISFFWKKRKLIRKPRNPKLCHPPPLACLYLAHRPQSAWTHSPPDSLGGGAESSDKKSESSGAPLVPWTISDLQVQLNRNRSAKI